MIESKIHETIVKDSNSSTVAELIIELKEKSGFNDKELAQLIGSSALSIHMWISGLFISNIYESRIRDLHKLILSLPARRPQSRRNMMIDETAGESLFNKFSNDSLKKKFVK